MDNATTEEQKDTHRIQFDIPDDLYQRAKRFFKDDRFRHYFGTVSFEERVNRLEGRDKKLQAERIKADAAYIQELIDSGEVVIKNC